MSKRKAILKTAAHLFATQGFDGTTTIQIAREAGVTEPLIYYHFKGKDELFTRIIESAFSDYFSRLDKIERHAGSAFDQLRLLIELQFDIIEEMPDEVYIIANSRPVKLNDTENFFISNILEYRRRILSFLTHCLSEGINAGELTRVPVETTANLIVAMLNGIVRQRVLHADRVDELRQTTVDFCRRSLLNKSAAL